MNKLNITFVFFICSLFSCDKFDESQLPEGINQKFKSAYPEAEHVVWDRLNHGYEANFKLNERRMEVEFNEEGNIREVETIISKDELPQKALDYIDDNYPWLFIAEVSVEERKDRKVYELEMLNGFFREMELEFDMEGNLVHQESFGSE